jgi:hypothetical protein
MYYPLSQIQTNLYTNGQEYALKSNNQNYIGFYWKTSNEKIFTGKTPQDLPTQELIIFASDRNQVLPPLSPAFSEIALAYDAPYIGDNPDLYNEVEILTYLNLKKVSTIFPPTIIIPTYTPTIPTVNDYQIGEYRRYFCKKTNEIVYLEIDKNTYDKLINKDSTILYQLYQPFNLPWQLTGDKSQVFITNKNITELTSKQQKLPMLSEYLRNDFTKYYK